MSNSLKEAADLEMKKYSESEEGKISTQINKILSNILELEREKKDIEDDLVQLNECVKNLTTELERQRLVRIAFEPRTYSKYMEEKNDE